MYSCYRQDFYQEFIFFSETHVSSTKLSGQVHLDTLRSSDDDLAATILSKHLGKTIWLQFKVWVGPFTETHTNPVGPAPNIRTDEPILGEILSRPCAAQDAGSS
jgi:hypothetical protein